MFRAQLAIGDEKLAVRLYAAASDARIHFRLLHAPDHVPVVQKMVDPVTGEEVPRGSIRRGLEVEPGQFVILEPAEIAELQPETTRTITCEAFIDRGALDAVWLDRPYFLGPDGNEASYFALVEALDDKIGIARWAMRNKRYVGALCVEGDHLALLKLRYAEQVALPAELTASAASDVDQKQVALARQLIETLEGDFDPDAFDNEHQALLRELLERKRSGQTVPIKKARKPKQTDNLAAALKKSLRAAKEKRVA